MIKNKFNKIKFLLFTLALITTAIFTLSIIKNKSKNYLRSTKFTQINSYQEIKDVFDNCDQNTLIIFDVDETLITTQDAFANDDWFPWYFKIIASIKYPKIIFDKEKIEHATSIAIQKATRYVFDPDIINIIKQLQNKNITVIALSYIKTGQVGIIENLPEWRANSLKHLGINFSYKYPNIIFTKLPKKNNNYPCLYKGILCTNEESKGLTLSAFLDYYNLKPDKVIFFDDKTDHLNSVSSECSRRKIIFTGYQVMRANKNKPTWNTRRALLQLDFIIKNSQFLSDEEADKFIDCNIQTN